MPALKVDGASPPKPVYTKAVGHLDKVNVNTHSTAAAGGDPLKGVSDLFNSFIGSLNIGPKPGAMASNKYLHDHGAGSVLRRKK